MLCEHVLLVNSVGGNKDNVISCKKCNGRGISIQLRQIGPGMVQQLQSVCSDCGGEGTYICLLLLLLLLCLCVYLCTSCSLVHTYMYTYVHTYVDNLCMSLSIVTIVWASVLFECLINTLFHNRQLRT